MFTQNLKLAGHLQNGFFSANAAGLAKMGNGFFANSDAARLKMADGFFSAGATGRSKVEALFAQSSHFDNDTIDVAKLAYQPAIDLGRFATGHLRNIAPNANDLVTVVVNGAIPPPGTVVYEWDGVGANVNVARGGGAVVEAAALRAAILANQGTVIASAIHAVDTTCIDLRVLVAGQDLNLVTTSAARVAFQDNAENLVPADRTVYEIRRTVTAEDAARANFRVDTGLTTIRNWTLRVITSNVLNTEILYNGTITAAGGVIEMNDDGLVDLGAGNIVVLEVLGD